MNDDAKTSDGATGLPASIELAWGVRERPTKGPKRGLSLERIVEAAVKIAVTDGLGAVSMNRVATTLGASTMSLYRYVESKEELLMLMVDAASGKPPPAEEPGEGWRAGLARWAWAYRTVLRRHPWMLRVPISGPPVTPNQIAWLDHGLRALGATHLEEGEKLSSMLLLSGFVRNEATLSADLTAAALAAGVTTPDVMPRYSRLLQRLTDPEQFPAIHAAIAAGALDDEDDEEHEFIFGLERLLDGIDVLDRERETAAPRSE
jgi:AcrR family transcriptional regulator